MIVDERLTAYLHSLDKTEEDPLPQIARAARQEAVPIIRPETGALLKVLIRLKNPRHILEVGTATGYSSLLMSTCLEPGARITTSENYPPRIRKARENIALAGKEDVITLLEGDALKILPALEGPFDFIFMDAAKGQYINFLPEVLRLLSPGGLLVSDNILQEGSIIDSRFAITRRDRTIHSRMRDYLWQLKHSPQLETSLLTSGDGVALSVKL